MGPTAEERLGMTTLRASAPAFVPSSFPVSCPSQLSQSRLSPACSAKKTHDNKRSKERLVNASRRRKQGQQEQQQQQQRRRRPQRHQHNSKQKVYGEQQPILCAKEEHGYVNASVSKNDSTVAFPSLAVATRSRTAQQQKQQHSPPSAAGVWSQSPVTIRHSLLFEEGNTENDGMGGDDGREAWITNGLSKLTATTTRSTIAAKRGQDLMYEAWDKEEKHDNDDDAGKNVDNSSNELTIRKEQEQLLHPKSNDSSRMDRLRDRWWDAVAKRQARRQLEAELHNALMERRRQIESDGDDDDDDDDDDDGGDDDDDDMLEGGANLRPDPQDEPPMNGRRPVLSNNHVVNHDTRDNVELADYVEATKLSCMTTAELLKRVIESENEEALREIMSRIVTRTNDQQHLEKDLIEEALEVVVSNNKPRLLRIIIYVVGSISLIDSISVSPLMVAASHGYEECLSLLLSGQSKASTQIMLIKDENGENVFHHCCRGHGDAVVLRLLLRHVQGNNTSKGKQQMSKLLLAQNQRLQIPLHVACELNKQSFVEVFLDTCSSSLLSKMLSVEDDRGQTPLFAAISHNADDIVLALIMWRGNHTVAPTKAPQYYAPGTTNNGKGDKSPPCPLVWAAKCGNLEMIELLLQFGDQWGKPYRLTEALWLLLQSTATPDVKMEGCHVLVMAGANPFEEVLSMQGAHVSQSAISVATKLGEPAVVKSAIESGKQRLHIIQVERRRDPILRMRPPVFFRQLAEKETKETKSALKNALVSSLFDGYLSHELQSLSMAVTLYEAGAQLDMCDLARLQVSMEEGRWCATVPVIRNTSFLSTYEHDFDPTQKRAEANHLDFDRSPALSHSSKLLLRLPWISKHVQPMNCTCRWVLENTAECLQPESNDVRRSKDEVVLICSEDGSRFLVHDSIVSAKCTKLGSAIRFSRMSHDDTLDETIEVPIDAPSHLVRPMIQHMYHGSVFLWPTDLKSEAMCSFTLELLLLAEEFLCQSLVQECEMRLLSSKPTICSCWSCSQATRPHPSDPLKAQCMYTVTNENTIGGLIQADTVLNVLGVTDFMQEAPAYDIKHVPMNDGDLEFAKSSWLWTIFDTSGDAGNLTALSALKDAAVLFILKSFASVTKSDSFRCSVEQSDSSRELLLQMCLDAVRTNAVLRASYQLPTACNSGRKVHAKNKQ